MLGFLSMINEPGTRLLWNCQGNGDSYESFDINCEGAGQRLGALGFVWSSPPADVPSVAFYRCWVRTNGEHFLSLDAGREGQALDGLFGYLHTGYLRTRPSRAFGVRVDSADPTRLIRDSCSDAPTNTPTNSLINTPGAALTAKAH